MTEVPVNGWVTRWACESRAGSPVTAPGDAKGDRRVTAKVRRDLQDSIPTVVLDPVAETKFAMGGTGVRGPIATRPSTGLVTGGNGGVVGAADSAAIVVVLVVIFLVGPASGGTGCTRGLSRDCKHVGVVLRSSSSKLVSRGRAKGVGFQRCCGVSFEGGRSGPLGLRPS